MQSLSDDLHKRVAKAGITKQVEASAIIEQATEALKKVMKEHASHIRPQYVKNGTLTVTCDSAAIAHQLKLQEPQILAEIHNNSGSTTTVERIRYLL